jgi:hypothetical protein
MAQIISKFQFGLIVVATIVNVTLTFGAIQSKTEYLEKQKASVTDVAILNQKICNIDSGFTELRKDIKEQNKDNSAKFETILKLLYAMK